MKEKQILINRKKMSKHNEDGELLKSIRPPSSENQHTKTYI